jgi:hypothetical protein
MTNTYSDDAPMDIKTFEEMRCLRSVLERLLRVMDRAEFVDYQMEKFSGSPEARKAEQEAAKPAITCPFPGYIFYPIGTGSAPSNNPCKDCQAIKRIQEQHPNGYVGDIPCQWCPHGNKVVW